MTGEIRPDFLNFLQFTKRLSGVLASVPHSLVDNFGNVISIFSPENAAPGTVEIQLRGKSVARLSAREPGRDLLKNMVEALLEAELKAADAACTLEAGQLLAADLDALLDISEAGNLPLENLLLQLLRLLRAHVWVERAAIYGMLDGFTFEGLAGLGWPDDSWKTDHSSSADITASLREPTITEQPQDGAQRNLASFPLLHGQSLMGVMRLSNRAGGPFSASDLQLLKRFANLATHLLQKHLFKTKMEELGRTNDNLGKYLSQKIVKDVKTKDELQLGGVEKKVVCLFSDIRGYTSITEDISAATLVQLLNFHFERMHAIIEKNEGTLDKIVGDLIMAVWNIPHDQPEPELLAMKAALEMQKEMIRVVIPEWQKHGVEKVGMGVGVNAGLALAGNLGSSRFMNYTVIGDAINTAQRLEAKAQAGEIWMAESIYPLVHGKMEKPVRRELDIRLKGKDKTINAFVYKPLQY